MRKSETVTIGDGYNYTITQLPLRESRALLVKLTNLIGPALGDAVKGDTDGVSIDGSSIGGAVKSIALALSDEDFDFVQSRLFKHITWTNDSGHEVSLADSRFVDEHFGGDGLDRMFKLIWAALRVQYADFLAGLGLGGLVQ